MAENQRRRAAVLAAVTLVACSPGATAAPDASTSSVEVTDAAALPDGAGVACPVCPTGPELDATAASVLDLTNLPLIKSEWQGSAPLARALYISDGDSIAFGYYVPVGNAFTALAAALAGQGVAFTQIAAPGAGIAGDAGEDSTFATRVLPLIRHDIPTIVSQNAGVNDTTATAAEIWAAQSDYCAQVRTAGAKCILLSLLPHAGNSYGKYETIRQLQRDHWAEVADGFADFALEPDLADASDLTAYVDGTHPTPSGHIAMLRRFLPALLGVLGDAGVR
jgi:lysophospholipase L1-like esterase